MSNTANDHYNLVDYPSGPLPLAHPNRLATMAMLYGMEPAPVDKCNVLEIGCGDGGHLIPCAFALPHSTFVGIDRAASAVERGKQNADTLDVTNIELQCADLMTMPVEGDLFDYILVNGLYSWVPAEVRDRLLELCKARLASNGVAFISYNCYPGCYQRRMIWEMMRFHVRDMTEPVQRIQQAQVFARLLAEGMTRGDDYEFLQSELEEITRKKHPGLLYHDDLSDINEPVYLHQFVDHAGQHGLQFLAETDFAEMHLPSVSAQIQDMLQTLESHDIVLKEQYLDFLTRRRFRRTLLCHQEVTLDRDIKPEKARSFRMLSSLRPVSREPDLTPLVAEKFQGPAGQPIELNHALSKAALVCLGERWPRSLAYAELLQLAKQRLQNEPSPAATADEPDPDENLLMEVLLTTYQAGLLIWQAYHEDWSPTVPENPRLRAINRQELEQGGRIVSLRDLTVVPIAEAFDRLVLLLADGSRTRDAICAEMQGRLQADDRLRSSTHGPDGPFDIELAVEKSLQTGERFGLFVAE